jgi:hypothetical protein
MDSGLGIVDSHMVEEYNSMEQKTIGRRCTKCDLKDYTYCCARVNFQEQPPISRYQSRQF